LLRMIINIGKPLQKVKQMISPVSIILKTQPSPFKRMVGMIKAPRWICFSENFAGVRALALAMIELIAEERNTFRL
jgi:hypothetical protein